MKTPDPGARTGPAFPAPGALTAALLFALAAVVADLFSPSNVLIPIVYGVPLLLCVWVRDLRFLWGLAAALALFAALGALWGTPVPEHTFTVLAVNRALAVITLAMIAGLVHRVLLTQRVVEGQRCTLEKHNAELEAVNQELTEREEEIVRQNEELQSQSEELERQSEELRITNEELAGREKMLEQLLELSRSLTADLSRSETLNRICEALGVLVDAPAAAVLEKEGDGMRVVCHHGFGKGGVEAETVPYAQSFAALVLSRGQTGYIEDLTLRPDLRVPHPGGEEPFRSVLSAPLRVRGRGVGTIETYQNQKQSWSDAQIAMVESLAAQASISLASAELVEAIQQERRRFEAVFRSVPFGMLVAEDAAYQRVRLNPAAAALLGIGAEENVAPTTPTGARLRRTISRDGRAVPTDDLPLGRALRGEEVRNDELDVQLSDGRRVALLASAAPIYDGKGAVAGAVCAFADISTQKTLQHELDLRRREAEEASQRKTRFLAAVSHDIRTPANAINLMAELIRRTAGSPALAGQVPDLAERLQANTTSLVDLVSDVLDLARFDSGKIDLQESEFSLGELLLEEGRHLLPLAQDKGLSLAVEPPDRPIWLRADRVKLARVLGNLVGNAIKFTPRGEVEVSAALTPARQAVLRVRDTGVGISSESLSHIFDEFVQLRNPERDRTKGTGLGLAISRRLVEVMGGELAVDSAPGRGSTFIVTLPASCVLLRLAAALAPPLAEARPARPAVSERPLAGLRVLLVEDHATTREGTTRILANEGAAVTAVADAASGLAEARRGGFHVLLLDMMLPDMDGREVLKTVRAERPDGLRAVLVLTGDLTEERVEEVKRLGADALIGKPIDVARLVSTLRTFVP